MRRADLPLSTVSRLVRRGPVVIGFAAALVLGLGSAAWAYVSATGSGTGTVTVLATATTSTLSSITTPVTHGAENESFSGHVTGVTGHGYPKGTVAVIAHSTSQSTTTTVCTATITTGTGKQATFTCTYSSPTVLAAGSYKVHAHYSGGKSSTPAIVYSASTSTAQTLTVSP